MRVCERASDHEFELHVFCCEQVNVASEMIELHVLVVARVARDRDSELCTSRDSGLFAPASFSLLPGGRRGHAAKERSQR